MVTVGVVACLTFALTIIYFKRASAAEREQRRAELRAKIEQAISNADSSAKRYDFDSATKALVAVEAGALASGDSRVESQFHEARRNIADGETAYNAKLKEGWVVVGGKLVSPQEQAKAIAEQAKKEEAERRRREAEAEAKRQEEERRRAEAAAQTEKDRLAKERAEAERALSDAVQKLPSLNTQLDSFAQDRFEWLLWFMTLELESLGGKPDEKYETLTKDGIIGLITAVDPRTSPILVVYRAEIIDLVRSLRYDSYVGRRDTSRLPILFALNDKKLALLVGSVASDTVYNNVNQAMNTPKKRAGAFMQREILPALMESQITDRLRAAKLEYFGIFFVYGHRNFVKEE